ncbi:Fic family protein [Pandoraea iniqua]|nr:Fic family protein [Pandoraea iniqua]
MSEATKAQRPKTHEARVMPAPQGRRDAHDAKASPLADNRPQTESLAQLRKAIDASPRAQAAAQRQTSIGQPMASTASLTSLAHPVAPSVDASTPNPPSNLASPARTRFPKTQPVQRVINFSPDVEKQYTKDSYLTKLRVVSRLSFDEIRRIWIAAENDDAHLVLSDNIELAWEQLKAFNDARDEDDEPEDPLNYPEDEVEALNAASVIPKTNRSGKGLHETRIKAHLKTIFPSAREESSEAQHPWDASNEVSVAGRLETVDYTTWDNLKKSERTLLQKNAENLPKLRRLLKQLVSENSNRKNDFLIALYSHLASLTGDGRAVGQQAGLKDNGQYLQTIVDVRRGRSNRVDAYRSRTATNGTDTDWSKEPSLAEDAPFLRQRQDQIKRRLENRKHELDVLRKWASPSTSVQSHNVGMDEDVVDKSTTDKKDNANPGTNIGLLDATLAEITPIEGTVYGAYPFNASLTAGELFSQGTPLSASESAGGTVVFSKGEDQGAMDRYKIYAKGFNGIPISPIVPSIGQGQREVVFRPRATFKILSIRSGKFGANVTREVTMEEQGESASHVAAVKKSQKALLNRDDQWLTRLPGDGIDQRTQRWFISNSTGGSVEGQDDASFAFPYGRKTAEAWHEVITDDGIDIWTVEGFRTIAAKLTGSTSKSVKIIKKTEAPSQWANPVTLSADKQEILKNHGMTVSAPDNGGRHTVGYKKEDKLAALKVVLQYGKQGAVAIGSGAGTRAAKEKEAASLAADIQQRLSVLHPVHDGNGRISRAYAYLILRRLGFGNAPLRLFDQDADQTTSPAEWQKSFANYEAGDEPHTDPKQQVRGFTKRLTQPANVESFVSALAGGSMQERFDEVRAEEEQIRSEDVVDEMHDWLAEEMFAFAAHRPNWLSKELRQSLDDFRLTYTAPAKGEDDPEQRTANFRDALQLKRQLSLELSEKLRATLVPDSPKKKSLNSKRAYEMPVKLSRAKAKNSMRYSDDLDADDEDEEARLDDDDEEEEARLKKKVKGPSDGRDIRRDWKTESPKKQTKNKSRRTPKYDDSDDDFIPEMSESDEDFEPKPAPRKNPERKAARKTLDDGKKRKR